jgi:hypothetical protein
MDSNRFEKWKISKFLHTYNNVWFEYKITFPHKFGGHFVN